METDPGKLDRIKDFLIPTFRDNFTSFIRLIKTLNNWSDTISPKMKKIRELNTKGAHFAWTEAHEEELKAIKEHLMETTRMATWHKNLPVKLYMDMTKTGGFRSVLT